MKPSKKKDTYSYPVILRIVADVIIGTGIICLFFGWQDYQKSQSIIGNKVSTRGIIVKTEKNGSRLFLHVQFKTENGYDIVFTREVKTGKDAREYSVGGKVGVLYDPEDPYNAFVYQNMEKEFMYIGWFTVGGLLILTGLSFIYISVYEARKVKR